MSHGIPLRSNEPSPCGIAGPFFIDVGISSTRRIAAFWGLAGEGRAQPAHVDARPKERSRAQLPSLPVARAARPERINATTSRPSAANSVTRIIEDALRAAGLMK
jgi:hypothetical protein